MSRNFKLTITLYWSKVTIMKRYKFAPKEYNFRKLTVLAISAIHHQKDKNVISIGSVPKPLNA